MRIRSIKPEFWRSDDIARLSWEDRLIFIGLWSYVDDNGVGRDEERLIVADLFALDNSFSEASLRVHAGLVRLHAANLIERYEVDGRRFLHITTWARHQKINRPSPGRYPLPTCGNAITHDTLTEDSLSPHNTLSAGTEEQGNRGTEEQGLKHLAQPADADVRDTNTTTSKASTYPEAFETFWSIYPIRRGKAKALTAWKRALKRAPATTINSGAARYRDDPNRVDEYTKYAEGWLNGDGWLDQPLPPRTGNRGPTTTDRVNGWLDLPTEIYSEPPEYQQIGARQ